MNMGVQPTRSFLGPIKKFVAHAASATQSPICKTKRQAAFKRWKSCGIAIKKVTRAKLSGFSLISCQTEPEVVQELIPKMVLLCHTSLVSIMLASVVALLRQRPSSSSPTSAYVIGRCAGVAKKQKMLYYLQTVLYVLYTTICYICIESSLPHVELRSHNRWRRVVHQRPTPMLAVRSTWLGGRVVAKPTKMGDDFNLSKCQIAL